jgi:hypothetical protein
VGSVFGALEFAGPSPLREHCGRLGAGSTRTGILEFDVCDGCLGQSHLLLAVPAAFGFARLRLPLPAVLGLAILVPLMIPSEIILVPLFVMFRALGLLNTLEGLITLEVAGGVAFATVVLTTFFRGVPRELEEGRPALVNQCRSVGFRRHSNQSRASR